MLKTMSWQLKVRLLAGLITITLLLADVISNQVVEVVLSYLVYLGVSYPILKASYRDIVIRHRMSEQFLMTIATFGALGLQDYAEALAVMVFYLIGKAFEDYASIRSHNEIASLVKLKPNKVRVIDEDGSERIVKPRQVKIGMKIRVLAGESVALDGTLIQDSASIDMSALNGESEPALFTKGQEVPSGVINMGSVIELIVTRDSKNSSITRLINLIEDAAANKSRPEDLITRFSVYYTPIVVSCAVLLALVPLVVPNEDFSNWFTRALVFLVVSCPCALVLSVPLSFFGGLGAISKTGVMVKGSIHIESLSKLKAIAFDKTGTITQGKFTVLQVDLFDEQGNLTTVYDLKLERHEAAVNYLLERLYALEVQTTHPIGSAIVNYCKEHGIELKEVTQVHEIPGFGISGLMDGHKIVVGKEALLKEHISYQVPSSNLVGSEIYVIEDSKVLGRIILADKIKESALPMFEELRALQISSYMITGDKNEVAQSIASQCHIDSFYAEQLPENKLQSFNKIKHKEGVVAFVGDGINDAPTLAASDIGIAMGQFGSASAVEAADVVVMNDDLSKIPVAIDLAKRTFALAKQNMILVIGVKALILLLGAFGFANIWLAILGDVGLCVIAVLNAMRPLYWVKTKALKLKEITA